MHIDYIVSKLSTDIMQKDIDSFLHLRTISKDNYNTTGYVNSIASKCLFITEPLIKLKMGFPIIIANNPQAFRKSSLRIKKIYVFVDDISNLNNTLSDISMQKVFQIYGNYYFVICEKVKSESWLHEASELVWKYSIINFVWIYYTNKVQLVAYNPFNRTLLNFTETDETFPDKYVNMYGYELDVSICNDEPRNFYKNGNFYGMDGNLMNIILQKLNASVNYHYTDGHMSAVADVRNRKTDFFLVGVIALSYVTFVQFSNPVSMDNVMVLVPKSNMGMFHNGSIIEFTDNVSWSVLLFTIFLLTIITFIMKALVWKFLHYKISNAFMDVLSMLCSLPLATFRNNRFSVKILFTFSYFSAILLQSLLQSTLVSSYVNKFQRGETQTLKELHESDLPVYTLSIFANYLLEHNPIVTNIRNKTIHEIVQSVNRGEKDGAYAVLQSYIFALSNRVYENRKHRNFWRNYQILDECLIPAFKSYIFPLRSPFISIFNKFIMLCNEFGLTQYSFKRDRKHFHDFGKSRKLKLFYFKQMFSVLIYCWILSFVIFVSEIIFYRRKKIILAIRNIGK